MSTALLLTDAEPDTRGLLEQQLLAHGFLLVDRAPDLVLAGDVGSVERWRDRAPVIVLGRSDAGAVDRVHAFRRGCDDYVVSPFDYQELIERIRAVLRRVRPDEQVVLTAATCRIDRGTRDVRVNGERVTLSHKEYELLVELALSPRRVFTKAELLRDVWGYRAKSRTRTLDSHASRLRRKLRDMDAETPWVDNVWGVGYRLLGTLPEL
jgi:DNA-binding response OmpR family regulator